MGINFFFKLILCFNFIGIIAFAQSHSISSVADTRLSRYLEDHPFGFGAATIIAEKQSAAVVIGKINVLMKKKLVELGRVDDFGIIFTTKPTELNSSVVINTFVSESDVEVIKSTKGVLRMDIPFQIKIKMGIAQRSYLKISANLEEILNEIDDSETKTKATVVGVSGVPPELISTYFLDNQIRVLNSAGRYSMIEATKQKILDLEKFELVQIVSTP